MAECRPNQRKLCGEPDCGICFERSFANTDKKSWWSSKNQLESNQVFRRTASTYIFNCGICGHEYDGKPCDIINSKSCKYCSSTAPMVCGVKNCISCRKKSLASINKVNVCWSVLNKVEAISVSAKTGRSKYWFDCLECDHVFKMRPKCVYEGQWCTYCSNKTLCGNYDCDKCFNNSFASHEKADSWFEPNLDPIMVHKCCDTVKYTFKCENGHTFKALPNNIVKGTWCPFCINKTENILFIFLQQKFPNVVHQKYFQWCSSNLTNRMYPFDFYIESENILVEMDGLQHFKQVRNWNSPTIQRERDVYKMKKARENGKRIIRLLQEDVWMDKIDWKKLLLEAIESNEPIIYIGDKYTNHIEDMEVVEEPVVPDYSNIIDDLDDIIVPDVVLSEVVSDIVVEKKKSKAEKKQDRLAKKKKNKELHRKLHNKKVAKSKSPQEANKDKPKKNKDKYNKHLKKKAYQDSYKAKQAAVKAAKNHYSQNSQ